MTRKFTPTRAGLICVQCLDYVPGIRMREFRLWTAQCRQVVVLAAGFLPVDREWIVTYDEVKPGEMWDRSDRAKAANQMVNSVCR